MAPGVLEGAGAYDTVETSAGLHRDHPTIHTHIHVDRSFGGVLQPNVHVFGHILGLWEKYAGPGEKPPSCYKFLTPLSLNVSPEY